MMIQRSEPKNLSILLFSVDDDVDASEILIPVCLVGCDRDLSEDEIRNGVRLLLSLTRLKKMNWTSYVLIPFEKQFKFDHVFSPKATQEVVFARTSPVITSVLDGYNVYIFAYGQTDTGKTCTMEGTTENRGVNYGTIEELFRIANERSSTMKYELFVSMLEV